MDNRKFDSIARSLASGTSRRSVLKGLFGLGGAALVGTVALDQQVDAARRPTPTPKPVTCPGRQTWNGAACVCPGDATNKCGPDCCTGTTTDPYPRVPGHSECCDNACCFGTCYGEELCCPTNSGPGEQPPTHIVCEGRSGLICVEGNCCDDSDCGNPCQVCNARTHTCEARCDTDSQVCCTGQAGPGICVDGECCPGLPGYCAQDELCCTGSAGTVCVEAEGETCPSACTTADDCEGCATCEQGLCHEGCGSGAICCDETCLSSSEYFTCPANDGCCVTADACCGDGCCSGVCYGGESGRDSCCDTLYCQDADQCCDDPSTEKCCGTAGCCAGQCTGEGGNECCTTGLQCPIPGPEGSAECCPNAADYTCCGTAGCCSSSQCNEEADFCCSEDSFACGTSEGNLCCGSATEKCCEGVCIDASECCAANGDICPTCAPNCDCADPANDGLDCNGGLAAGGGVCACGYCVVPLDGCPCGCAGDTECVRCSDAADGTCETYNQGESCNGGAGICQDEWCVAPPPVDCEALCAIGDRCGTVDSCECTCNEGLFCMPNSTFCCPGIGLGTDDNCAYCGDVCPDGTDCNLNANGTYECQTTCLPLTCADAPVYSCPYAFDAGCGLILDCSGNCPDGQSCNQSGWCCGDAGQTCANEYECCSLFCCNGTCSDTKCCTPNIGNCDDDVDCCSQLCQGGVCVSCKTSGICDSSGDCCSGYYCSGGSCQMQ